MRQPPGHDGQFDRWVAEHVEVLYRVAFRLLGDPHDAEDVVQDAFRSAWVSRHRFDPERSERAWLLAILRRRAADHWRRTDGRQQPATDRMTEQAAPADPDPFSDELSAVLQRALDVLPRELRETLLLVVVGGLTHQEAADLLSVPLGTVLSRVSRARGRLREMLLAATDGHVAAASARRGRSHE
ncbi:MAG: polymerase sigma factor SigW [Planctomycetota bacterium]|jgi:RNA polymerase sigma-70 factor (ECF subfamily)